MIKFYVFVALSIGLAVLSRRSLINPRSHGFYRFFAWEFILILFLRNLEVWFHDPWSLHQLISWGLLIASLVPLFFGIRSLVTEGKPVNQRQGEPHLLAFERTTALVTTGIYQYIRHPLYSSLLLLAWGIFFKSPDWIGLILVLMASLSLVATARADEAECRRFFGGAYDDYMENTRMFIPFVF